MQKNHIGGIHIAKKIALCIFLVSATLSAVPKSTFGATFSVFQVIQKKVTISMKNATLETILAEINRQTGLDYGFQSNGSVDKNRRFTLEVTDITVEEAGTPIVDRYIDNVPILINGTGIKDFTGFFDNVCLNCVLCYCVVDVVLNKIDFNLFLSTATRKDQKRKSQCAKNCFHNTWIIC